MEIFNNSPSLTQNIKAISYFRLATRDMRNKNYYKILEIPLSASQQEVKKAYRHLAMKYHPDKNVDNQFAESHFREINEAYQVLSDPNRRSAYNQARWYRQSLHQQNAKIITPESILVKCRDLNQYIRQLDHYRINQQALHTYIMHLLSEKNLRLLTENGNQEVNSAIIDEMLYAGKLLSYTYMKKLGEQLMRLAINDTQATKRIFSSVRESRINGYWQQYQPFLILIVTLLLCWLIYLISK